MSTRAQMIERLNALLDRDIQAERFGSNDEYEDGAILTFTRSFIPGGVTYTYAAIRSRGVWWITGKSQYPLTFDDLVEKHLLDADEVVLLTEGEVL